MKRKPQRELLDDDRGSPQEIADSLADLRFLNKYFGGHSTSLALVRQACEHCGVGGNGSDVTLLDVGGASGDTAEFLRERMAAAGIKLRVLVLDAASSHLAPRASHAALAGSAFSLPFRDASVDIVFCSLFLHHLSPADAARFLGEARRVARRAILVNDLRRSQLHRIFAILGRAVYRSPITRHDAVASVEQSYTADEMAELAKEAGFRDANISRHFFFRLGMALYR